MTCTRCHSSDIHRSRRKGAWDNLQAWFGRYPYRCEDCGLRFAATGRYLDRESGNARNDYAKSSPQYATAGQNGSAGPEMAFRSHPAKPQAKIVVQAETHEQLNHILLSLDKAINSYGKSAKPDSARASYAAR